MIERVAWISAFAAAHGLRYEPEADERWLRAWEPYATLKVPIRYEHALHATGEQGSISIARAVTTHVVGGVESEAATWIAIVQDVRTTARVAVTNEFVGVFGEPLAMVSLARLATGDAVFDHVFASFASSEEDLARALTPSLRKLLMSFRVPIHAEVRPGGFVFAPVSLKADAQDLGWLFQAVHLFGEKATKRAS